MNQWIKKQGRSSRGQSAMGTRSQIAYRSQLKWWGWFPLTVLMTLWGCPAWSQEKLVDFDYWASLCQTLQSAQEYDKALEACDQAVGMFPDDPEAWHNRGDVLVALNRRAEALISYEMALRQAPRDSLILAKRCATLTALNRLEDAITACEEGLAVDGDWREDNAAIAWYHRGEAFIQSGKPAEALESYDWAIRTDPDYSPALAGRCLALGQMDRLESALADCDRALQANQWGQESRALGWLRRAQVLALAGQYPAALDAYNDALALDPGNERAWTEQGVVLGRIGRQTEALASHTWAVGIKENYAYALTNQCTALNRLGQYEEAIAACDQALQTGDNRWNELGPALAWNQRGNALAGLARYEEGLASLNRAISLRADYDEAWINRAVVLWLLQRYDHALDSIHYAVRLNPNSSRAWFNQGRILVSLGSFGEAAQAYRNALDGDVTLGGQPAAEDIWVNLSAVLWRLGRYGEAINAANEAIALDPELFLGWYNKALNLMSSGQYTAAISAYETALELKPTDANAWAGLGMTWRRLGKQPEALAALQKALELNPDNVQVQENLEAVMKAIAEAQANNP